MASEQLPLLFFKPLPGTDALAVVESLLAGSSSVPVAPLDPDRVLRSLKSTRGFGRLEITLPLFCLDNSRLDAALEGTATETQIAVRFYGDFDKLAGPLFKALTAEGLACYSVWDKNLLASWPEREEPTIDKGFAARMTSIMERKTRELRETEPDEKRRARILNEFARSPEFRAEMARAARLETSTGKRQKKTYSDHVNCYVRWRDGRPAASELAVVRKIAPKLAAMGIAELRNLIGDAPRLLLLTAAPPRQAAELRAAAERYGILLEEELA